MIPRHALLALPLLLAAMPARSTPTHVPVSREAARPIRTRADAPNVLHSSGSDLAKTATDTFTLYGGPERPTEGSFQVNAGLIPDRQGWIGVDLTDAPVLWQVSDFNAANLGGHGPGNLAAWCGQTAAQRPGWVHTPGYGNGWNESLLFEAPVSNPSVGQVVDLDFAFNYDTEPDYDFLNVEYDSAGTWVSVLSLSGTSHDGAGNFAAPGLRFQDVVTHPIVYTGGDYGWGSTNAISLRIRFSSDGAWSDEDGLQITAGGAVQIDDISVTHADGSSFSDFETGGIDQGWRVDKLPFAGDFSKVWTRLADGNLDECHENTSPIMAFVDGGQTVGNAASAALIPGYPTSTGGVTSVNWNYGVPGGWVVNSDGGLSSGLVRLVNVVRSPEIDWDLPTPADDDPAVSGVELSFDVWSHLPLMNDIFYVWSVRSFDGTLWGDWQDRNFIYYGGGAPHWLRHVEDVSDLIPPGTQRVQIRLGALELSLEFSSGDTTPSPAFDNVHLVKFREVGPRMSTRTTDLANDSFPQGGGLDVSTATARDALDIRFDMAREISNFQAPNLDPGDSLIVDFTTVVPGTTITDRRLVWVLDKNPLFEDALRAAPAGAFDANVDTSNPTRWSGEVLGQQSTTSTGFVVANRYFFDLPDADFLYPGDTLRYYFRATDSDGRVNTLPSSTTGFADGLGYDPNFVVHGLPSIRDSAGAQPPKLVYQTAGAGKDDQPIATALGQLGLVEGMDFDVFTVMCASCVNSNRLGSAGAWGATAAQLSGYDTILVLSGDQSSGLGDGSGTRPNTKSNDLGLLTAWHALPGMRNVAYFGDSVTSATAGGSSAGATYVQSVLSAQVLGDDLRSQVGGRTVLAVAPIDPGFSSSFSSFGGCPNIRQFDQLLALPPATAGHGIVDNGGGTYSGFAASILHDRVEGGDRKVDLVFPFAFASVGSTLKTPVATSPRSELLREVFQVFSVSSSGGLVTAVPSLARAILSVHPNPFNPRTTIRLSGVGGGSTGSIIIYNLRGERVNTLHRGPYRDAEFLWTGLDDEGKRVASGVYVVDAIVDGEHHRTKLALFR